MIFVSVPVRGMRDLYNSSTYFLPPTQTTSFRPRQGNEGFVSTAVLWNKGGGVVSVPVRGMRDLYYLITEGIEFIMIVSVPVRGMRDLY